MRKSVYSHRLNLRKGDLVEVCSQAEIFETLDPMGRLDGLPFMPEMLAYCGKQFRVYKRADKTCDTICNTGARRMSGTVHLEELRCDGSSHDGCQARCLIFWKEAWLKRVQPNWLQRTSSRIHRGFFSSSVQGPEQKSKSTDRQLITSSSDENEPEIKVYYCQATELLKASTYLPWWDVRQYVRDIWYSNESILNLLKAVFFRAFNNALKVGGYGILIWSYNRYQNMRGGVRYPYRVGKLKKTPTEDLGLKPGDFVQIKTHDEILETLDQRNRNRGLLFDVEMVPFCGGKYRVLQKVERIVDEKTGRMSTLPGTCIMLEGVTCKSLYSDRRIACPRAIYSYWREIWLKRSY